MRASVPSRDQLKALIGGRSLKGSGGPAEGPLDVDCRPLSVNSESSERLWCYQALLSFRLMSFLGPSGSRGPRH